MAAAGTGAVGTGLELSHTEMLCVTLGSRTHSWIARSYSSKETSAVFFIAYLYSSLRAGSACQALM